MLKNLCQNMLTELQEYKHTPEDRLLHYMNKRLCESLNTYHKELSESIDYLSRRKDPSKIVRKMMK